MYIPTLICFYHSMERIFFTCANREMSRVSRPISLINHKNIGFLSNAGPDHIKITKLPSQRLMFDHHRSASETPFNWCFAGVIWCFAGGPMVARFSTIWIFSALIRHKKVVRDGPPLAKLT